MTFRGPTWLLALVAVLLSADLLVRLAPDAHAQAGVPPVHDVLRARLIELVSPQGQVVGQLHTAEDGGANLRLRSGQGEVRVKLGATAEGAGLVLLDRHTEPALQLHAAPAGPAITLEERGKARRVLAP